ncbi:hypothetical protein TMA_085 [Thermus phage TMA]|uniref:hypothetical protein n=1 Tax=Thermus phage TMA TaxID=699370 RepID=UPI00021AADC6|nr:hypothetical protein TMA_085 [Thermus phage TMA]BAK53773.1 hypothetical protein TMA_085 [Thermus phage TMA]
MRVEVMSMTRQEKEALKEFLESLNLGISAKILEDEDFGEVLLLDFSETLSKLDFVHHSLAVFPDRVLLIRQRGLEVPYVKEFK